MKKAAKFFRIVGGLLMLSEIAYLFLPVIKASQENYPTKYYSQIKFLKDVIKGYVSGAKEIKVLQADFIACLLFIALPVVLSVIFGIVCLATGACQRICGIASIVSGGLNIAFYFNAVSMGKIYKKQYQTISKQPLLNVILVAAVLLMLFGVMLIISKASKQKADSENVSPMSEPFYGDTAGEAMGNSQINGIDAGGNAEMAANMQMSANGEMPTEANAEMQANQEMPVNAEMQVNSDMQSNQDLSANQDSEVTEAEYFEPEQTQEETVGEPRGVMVGLSGMYKGAEIPFKSGESIKFGRDTSNDMVFTDAPRVSRHHCVITWDGENKVYQIIDNSSNGCYINGMEECIPQNIPLRLEIGTIIDIGDENNRFRLE